MSFGIQKTRSLMLALVATISLGLTNGAAAPRLIGNAEPIDAEQWLQDGGRIDLLEYFDRSEEEKSNPKKEWVSKKQVYMFFEYYNELVENEDLPIGVFYVVSGLASFENNDQDAIAASGISENTFYRYVRIGREIFREHLQLLPVSA